VSKYGGYEDLPFMGELYEYIPGYTVRGDRDFYLQYCKSTDGKVLELGCGTGRVLIPIAEAGCRITGLDLSEYMLSECRQKLQKKDNDIQSRTRLIQGDMRNFKIDDTFSTTIMPFRPFQHLIDAGDQLSCLKNINKHLAKKGRLIFDVFQVNLEIITRPLSGEEIEDLPQCELPDGRKLRRTGRLTAYQRAEQYNDVELIYYLTDTNGTTKRIVHAFPMRYFFRYEVEHLLARCGFKIIDLFGDFDKSPLTDDSPEMIFIAEKVS